MCVTCRSKGLRVFGVLFFENYESRFVTVFDYLHGISQLRGKTERDSSFAHEILLFEVATVEVVFVERRNVKYKHPCFLTREQADQRTDEHKHVVVSFTKKVTSHNLQTRSPG